MDKKALPAGWEWRRLGDYIKKVGSGVTPQGGLAVYSKSGIPLIRSQNVRMNNFDMEGLAFISEEIDAEMQNSRVLPSDILLNITGASIGRVCVVPDEICPANVNQHVSIIRTTNQILPSFLAYYISSPSFQKYIDNVQAGGTRQALTKALIEDFFIPIPPLPEQKRIAAILTERLAAVERARKASEARLEAARALPAAYLREVFESEEARGWPIFKLGEVMRLRRDIVHPKNNPSGDSIFVGLEHIESGAGIRIGCERVKQEHLEGRKPQFFANDIVYGYLRPYLNKVWIADFDGLCSVDQYVYWVNGATALNEYVAWYLRSPVYLERAPIGITPGQLPRIRIDEVEATEINLPSLEKQNSVVSEIRRKIGISVRVKSDIEAELDAISRLAPSLLHQAFSGLL